MAPKLLSIQMISKAMSDHSFYKILPEFLPFRERVITTKVEITKAGCSGCKTRRVIQNLSKEFVHTALSLSPEAKQRLNKYFSSDKLLINFIHPQTHQVSVQLL